MRRPFVVALLVLAALQGCTKEASPPSVVPAAVQLPGAPPKLHAPQLPHSRAPEVVACTAALEKGDLAQARALLLELGEREAPDSDCLRARLLAAQGDAVGAVREIQAAHKRFPGQSALYATLAEIYATDGRLESAQDEIRSGLAVAGPTPDLARARGVLMLLQQGGARAGLKHLLAAVHDAPDLPFCRAPLAEAHRLVATEELGKQHPVEALAHVRLGLELEPENPDLQLLQADALIANQKYDEGLPAYEELVRKGRDIGAALRLYYQKGATFALVEGRP
ncbi:MAG TPA: tetratricopeptide repeat protein, partial [Planctomycetota bacterium]|nr:tetratricopeptide repeat protein [Planctomycetota bacterium]